MLFLSESIFESRSRLLRDLDRGKITSEQAYRRLLDLEPAHHIALPGISRLRREAGDLASAEDYLWRAAQASPAFGNRTWRCPNCLPGKRPFLRGWLNWL